MKSAGRMLRTFARCQILLALPACATQATEPLPQAALAQSAGASTPAPAIESSPCAPIDQPFIGTLCVPGGRGRHPAIAFFDGYGGNGDARRLALEFAARGFVTAAVSYFGTATTSSATRIFTTMLRRSLRWVPRSTQKKETNRAR